MTEQAGVPAPDEELAGNVSEVAEVADQFVELPGDAPNVPNQGVGDTNGEFDSDIQLDAFTEKLLSDPSIKELPTDKQRQVIMDRFLGAIVRKGEVTTSKREKWGVKDMVDATRLSAAGINNYAPDIKDRLPYLTEVTSKGGLRASVEKLANDPRTNTEYWFNQYLSDKETTNSAGIKIEEVRGHDEVTLTSLEQIEGYLIVNPGSDKESVATVLNKIKETIAGKSKPGETWKDLTDLTFWGKDSQSYAKMASWTDAISAVAKAGADIQLLGRSVKAATEIASKAA